MKDPVSRTKVVVRHLPPTISPAVLTAHVDSRFSGRYRWTAFRPGKISHKNMQFARAYIDFRKPEDVFEFAEFFDGHVFVNEKGTQFKTIVEYAPSRRIPKSSSRKDGREGTIFKDTEYLEFLEMLAKPVGNLPSAEVQLERREAERAGVLKESIIVTPLMEFVRWKRVAKSGSQRAPSTGKLSERPKGPPTTTSASHKHGPKKRRPSTSMYVLRDSSKVSSSEEKSGYVVISRKVEQILDTVPVSARSELLQDDNGTSGPMEAGKKKLLLLKGKLKEASHASVSVSHLVGSPPSKPNLHQQEKGRRVIILPNKVIQQYSSQPASIQAGQHLRALQLEKEKCAPTSTRSVPKDYSADSVDSDTKRPADEKIISSESRGLGTVGDKTDRRTRNKERLDRVIWTQRTLQTTDGSPASRKVNRPSTEVIDRSCVSRQVNGSKSEENRLESASGTNFSQLYSTSGSLNQDRIGNPDTSSSTELSQNHGETRVDSAGALQGGEIKANGSYRYSRRGPIPGSKDVESLPSLLDGKPLKRDSVYISHEKQIWVQKSRSGS